MLQTLALNIIGNNIEFHTKLREHESPEKPPFKTRGGSEMPWDTKILKKCSIVGTPSMITHTSNVTTFMYPHIMTLIVVNAKSWQENIEYGVRSLLYYQSVGHKIVFIIENLPFMDNDLIEKIMYTYESFMKKYQIKNNFIVIPVDESFNNVYNYSSYKYRSQESITLQQLVDQYDFGTIEPSSFFKAKTTEVYNLGNELYLMCYVESGSFKRGNNFTMYPSGTKITGDQYKFSSMQDQTEFLKYDAFAINIDKTLFSNEQINVMKEDVMITNDYSKGYEMTTTFEFEGTVLLDNMLSKENFKKGIKVRCDHEFQTKNKSFWGILLNDPVEAKVGDTVIYRIKLTGNERTDINHKTLTPMSQDEFFSRIFVWPMQPNPKSEWRCDAFYSVGGHITKVNC
jgi:hypothetical protein